MKTLHNLLGDIHDFRRLQGRRFSLQAFLEMVVLAGMSGHFGINSISRFIRNNEVYFEQRYGLAHGVPKKTVIFNILSVIDYSDLNKVLVRWMSQYLDSEQHGWLSIDGKALASTVEDKFGNAQNFASIVSLFSKELEVVLDSQPIESKKSHEGQAAREIIEGLELKGITFTLDALHCQKKRPKLSWSLEMTM